MLVKLGAAEEKMVGGILLPSTAQSKPQGGEVVAVGAGRTIGDKKIEVGVQVNSCFLVVYSVMGFAGELSMKIYRNPTFLAVTSSSVYPTIILYFDYIFLQRM